MRKEANFKIFHQAFSLRIEIATALSDSLKPPKENLERLKAACSALEKTISEIGWGDVETEYRAYLTATSIFVPLAEWKHATRNSDANARRFLESARVKASEVDMSSNLSSIDRLSYFLEQVFNLENMDKLAGLRDHLERWDLPLLLFADLPSHGNFGLNVAIPEDASPKLEKINTTVAFLKFDIDGKPAKQCNYLKPGTAYDLTIEVRVSDWPDDACALSLIPVTVEARERNWLPRFRFDKPDGNGPFILGGTGRAVLEVPHSFGSRPYEFLYAAEFEDTSACCDIAVVGHRRLLLEGTDVASNPLTGFQDVDQHLLKIRDKLRHFPGLLSSDVANTMIVLGGLGNIASQALRNGLFKSGTSEKLFQSIATEMLQNRSDIGEDLQGHAEAGGGITDLTFRNIPIELKVENRKVVFPKDCEAFFNQTAAYALALGKRIGVLSVLECSDKTMPLGVIEDDISVVSHECGRSSILIAVVIIRGGFPKPSSYSRAGR